LPDVFPTLIAVVVALRHLCVTERTILQHGSYVSTRVSSAGTVTPFQGHSGRLARSRAFGADSLH
jgi:hypothetical protein